jgi:hypothetical protein
MKSRSLFLEKAQINLKKETASFNNEKHVCFEIWLLLNNLRGRKNIIWHFVTNAILEFILNIDYSDHSIENVLKIISSK